MRHGIPLHAANGTFRRSPQGLAVTAAEGRDGRLRVLGGGGGGGDAGGGRKGRVLAIVLPGAVAGIAFGWATARIVPETAVTALIGLIGVAFALNLLLRHKVKAEPTRAEVAPGVFWGAVTGFTSFVSHSGGPPYQVYTLPLGMPKAVFAGTSTIAFAVINAVKLVPYWQLGQLSAGNLKHAALLFVPSVVAVFAGVRLVQWLPERLFFQLVTWSLLLISLKLVWDGARGLMG